MSRSPAARPARRERDDRRAFASEGHLNTAEGHVTKLLARFHDLLEQAPDPIIVIDARGRIVLVNARVEQLFGYARDELLERRASTIVPACLVVLLSRRGGLTQDHKRDARAGTTFVLTVRHRDGSEVPAEVTRAPFCAAEGPHTILAIREIGERKAALSDGAG